MFHYHDDIDISAVRDVFTEKGFSQPEEFTLNKLSLWLFRKQLLIDDNYVMSQSGSSLYATGTLVYKGKSYKKSLISLLNDFDAGRIAYNEFIGAFCIIFFKDGNVSILTDRSNIYHIFSNKSQTIFSSSYLALIAAHKNRLSLNKNGCLENLINGYITGPDTLTNDVLLINNCAKKTTGLNLVNFMQWPASDFETQSYSSFNESVNRQLEVLTNYYKNISSLASEYSTDIGLSGGYDSRLNLLLCDLLPRKTTAHSHFSEFHYNEIKIAKMLAEESGLRLNKILISDPMKMTEQQLYANLSDSLFYYDGRSNKTMGTYNDVHTRKYRLSVLSGSKFGLNGLGGELYRNHNYTCYKKFNFIEWIKFHVMDPYTVNSMNNRGDLKEYLDYLVIKYKRLLSLDDMCYITLHNSRLFYADIYLPYSVGIKNSAENQLSFFLMPFSEWQVTREALKATKYIGVSGKFESMMIKTLNSKIASIPSSYGFNFDSEPLHHMMISAIKCYTPNRIKNTYWFLKLKYNRLINKKYEYSRLRNYKIFKNIIEVLNETGLPVNWDALFINKTHFERTIYLGHFLYRFSDKINLVK